MPVETEVEFDVVQAVEAAEEAEEADMKKSSIAYWSVQEGREKVGAPSLQSHSDSRDWPAGPFA